MQLAQGVGVQPAKGFWADAWAQVLKRPGAVAALCWIGIVAFFAVYTPLLVNGHPLLMREIGPEGAAGRLSSPLLSHLRTSDAVLLIGVTLAVPWVALAGRGRRAGRLGAVLYGAAGATAIVVGAALIRAWLSQRDVPDWANSLRQSWWIGWAVAAALALVAAAPAAALPMRRGGAQRGTVAAIAGLVAFLAVGLTWRQPLEVFDYLDREAKGEVRATYTIVPWSASQRFAALDRKPPLTTYGEATGLPAGTPGVGRVFVMGTDAFGQDVLAQVLTACRLSISIGLVSTGIAVTIGATLGALMGYFGGWVDLVLFRVVEIFMAVPLLFLLIVAAAVLPPEMRSTYTMMAIIGCFTWTGAARFTRAEFMKLRHQDFVQAARAVGVPVRSVLFRHMLPNGVTPVLVDASFTIAAAIAIEATLSFLGLGPEDQASWGKLLTSATTAEGQFRWWLAVFPGAAIFLTVLGYNMVGEALRDAIDPKLKKARV